MYVENREEKADNTYANSTHGTQRRNKETDQEAPFKPPSPFEALLVDYFGV